MRHFSDFEKEIIRELVREKEPVIEMNGCYYSTTFLGRLLHDKLSIIHLKVIEDGNMIKMVFDNSTEQRRESFATPYQANNPDNTDIEKEKKKKKKALEQVSKEKELLFDLVLLIKYLESNWLLGLSPIKGKDSTDVEWTLAGWIKPTENSFPNNFPLEDLEEVGEVFLKTHWHKIDENGNPIRFGGDWKSGHIIATTRSKDILRYAYSQYYPSQELRELVANDFKSNEQMQLDEAKMQTQYSRISVWLALVAVILAVMPLISKHSHPLMEWLCKLLRG